MVSRSNSHVCYVMGKNEERERKNIFVPNCDLSVDCLPARVTPAGPIRAGELGPAPHRSPFLPVEWEQTAWSTAIQLMGGSEWNAVQTITCSFN